MLFRSPYAGAVAAAFFALLVAAGALAARAGAAPASGAAQPLTPDVRFDTPVIRAGETAQVHVMITLHAPDHAWPGDEDRPPVNLALVLDRSGSMADRGKLDYAKRAARLAVGRLALTDRVAVVEYDDRVSVLWPSAPVENVAELHRRIDALEPRGSTDLTGGMMRGAGEVAAHYDPRDLNRVILLSDGLANQGITDPYRIGRLVRDARRDGIRISTVGLGLDYDENLMQAIAENGGGTYHYVEHPSQIARIFEEELSSLMRTTVRDIHLRFEGSGAVRGIEVISVEEGDAASIAAGDLFAGETQTVMLRLDVDAHAAGPVALGSLAMSYRDARTGEAVTLDLPMEVTASEDAERIAAARDKDVAVEAALFTAERTHARAVAAFESGNTGEADSLFAGLAADVGRKAEALGDSRLDAKLEALTVERQQMAAAEAAPAARSAYLKGAKQRLYQAQTGKRAGYLLQPGDAGLEVERLQRALADAGYWQGPVDGTYTDELAVAVDAFQTDRGLRADGTAGPETLDELGLY